MSVHRICEFDPFWTKKFFLQKDTQTDGQTDGNTHRHRSSNSSLDMELMINISVFPTGHRFMLDQVSFIVQIYFGNLCRPRANENSNNAKKF